MKEIDWSRQETHYGERNNICSNENRKKKTDLRCVAVENLRMKLIIGFPGLRDLGLSTDLKHICEMEEN